jgi:hypothetical protein
MAQTNRNSARRRWHILGGAPASTGDDPTQPVSNGAIPAGTAADQRPRVVWQGRPPYPVYLNQLPMHAPEAFGHFGF